jgi:predicted anti-sigma-YlaC factor YlaD
MKKNIGTADRLLRLAIAVILLLFAWWQSSWIALVFSLFTFYEALAGWCVLYQLLGKNSCDR